MLFRRPLLDRIRAGEVTHAFRRGERPRARAGGRQRTAVGELAIESVERVEPASITEADARRAGSDSLDDLLAELAAHPDRPVWRIELPRIRALVEGAGYDGPIEVEVINPALAELPTSELMAAVRERFERCC